MDEFEFDDDIETEDKSFVSSSICSSPSGNSTVSFSNPSTSKQTTGGNKRRRRHRLNHGSSKLQCRKRDIDIVPEKVAALDRTLCHSHELCDSSNSGESSAAQQPLSKEMKEDENRNFHLKEQRSLSEFSRRRRRRFPSAKVNQNQLDFLSGSTKSLLSPSSFLSDHSSLGVLTGKGDIMVDELRKVPLPKIKNPGDFYAVENKISSDSKYRKDGNLNCKSGNKVTVLRGVDDSSPTDDSRLDDSQSNVNMRGKQTRETKSFGKSVSGSPSTKGSVDESQSNEQMPVKRSGKNKSEGREVEGITAAFTSSIDDSRLDDAQSIIEHAESNETRSSEISLTRKDMSATDSQSNVNMRGKQTRETKSFGKHVSGSPSIKGSRLDDSHSNVNMPGKGSGKNKNEGREVGGIAAAFTSSIDDSRLDDAQSSIEHAESNETRSSEISFTRKDMNAASKQNFINKDSSEALHEDGIQRKDYASPSVVSIRKSESQDMVSITLTKKSSHRRPKQKSLRDDDVFTANYYGDDLNEGFIESSQSSQNSSIVSFSPNSSEKVITGARSDAFAVQDAGSYRLLSDDCNYFCSSFLSSIGAEEKCIMPKIHNTISADAACDLALMLSSKKTRQIMANVGNTHTDMNNGSQGSEPSIENCPYDSILTVLSFPPESISGSSLNRVDLDSISEAQTCSKEETIRRNGAFQRKTKNARTLEASKPNKYSLSNKNCYDTIVSNALATIAHHISLDCTGNADHSAMRTPVAARHFRMKILKERKAILGITKLVLADQIVSSIFAKNVSSESRDENIATCHLSNNECDSQKNIGRNTLSDPTRLGRKKKRRRKPLVEPEEEIRDPSASQYCANVGKSACANHKSANFDFHSVGTPQSIASSVRSIESFSIIGESIPKRFKKKLVSILSKTNIQSLSNSKTDVEVSSKTCNYCCDGSLHANESNPGHLALTALNRILTGKYNEDDEGEMGQNDMSTMDLEPNNDQHTAIDVECCDADEIETSNFDDPMVQKNVLFRQSGAIPFLVRAMIETLEAAVLLTSNVSRDKKTPKGDTECTHAPYCSLCLRHLYDRVHYISTTIDGLCCMSQPNRNMICGMTSTSIIPSLLKYLSTLLATSKSYGKYHNLVRDISVATLRTLTCLTHENDLAATQMISSFVHEPLIPSDNASGIEIILRLLHRFELGSRWINEKSESQHYHDAIIFCLNILTNTLESSCVHIVRKKILEMKLRESGNVTRQLAPAWLACWVVRQTESFRDVLLSGSFGHNDEKQVDNGKCRELKLHEDEYLVRAGNGCILLACLLREQKQSTGEAKNETQKLRDLILSEMPISKHGDRMMLIINTMKAFCNFYRYSIGEFMSVAITAPVVKLIGEVQGIQHHILEN